MVVFGYFRSFLRSFFTSVSSDKIIMIFYGKSRFVVLSSTSQPIFLGSHYRSCYSNSPPLYEYAGWLSSWRYLAGLSLHDVSALAMASCLRAKAIPSMWLFGSSKMALREKLWRKLWERALIFIIFAESWGIQSFVFALLRIAKPLP